MSNKCSRQLFLMDRHLIRQVRIVATHHEVKQVRMLLSSFLLFLSFPSNYLHKNEPTTKRKNRYYLGIMEKHIDEIPGSYINAQTPDHLKSLNSVLRTLELFIRF